MAVLRAGMVLPLVFILSLPLELRKVPSILRAWPGRPPDLLDLDGEVVDHVEQEPERAFEDVCRRAVVVLDGQSPALFVDFLEHPLGHAREIGRGETWLLEIVAAGHDRPERMDDDYLITIRSGGSPALWLALAVPGAVLIFVCGVIGAVVLALAGQAGHGALALGVAAIPSLVMVPLAIHFWRKHQRFLNILKNGQRVFGEVLLAERGMGSWRRRGRLMRMDHEGVFVTGTVQVRVRLSDGSFHIGTCKGWYRPAELEALSAGAPAPVIYLPGVPQVIVAQATPN